MSGFTFKGTDFNNIVNTNGTSQFGNYTKSDGTPLKYNAGTSYSRIDPTPGDISQAFKFNGTFPSNVASGSPVIYSGNTVNTTVTAPGWANSFKVYVKTRKGSTGVKYESSQGGQRGPNQGKAGHNGKIVHSNTYTPIGTNRNFTLKVGNADNSFTGIYQSNLTIGANAGGHGEPIQEGHTSQSPYYRPSGPTANTSVSGTGATTHTADNSNYESSAHMYWFS